ncbi:MAG: hypothetical protein MJ198_00530 [Bacteroidales bacterium]|nr:hypothetical protein [Bacteroidales bacterium]
MEKIVALFTFFFAVASAQAQITASGNIHNPEGLQTGNMLGSIAVEESFTADSLDCDFTCAVVPESNAIRLTASNPKGMRFVYRRGYTKLHEQKFDDNVIFLDIKGTFEGKYIIDIYDEENIRVKSYVIQRKL